MPSSKVAPSPPPSQRDEGVVGAAKVHGKKAAAKKKQSVAGPSGGAPAPAKLKRDEDPYGDPDAYPRGLAIGPAQFVEFHERADESLTLSHFSDSFSSMLPREQVECFQRLVLFNQMIGRTIHASTRLAYETDYFHLLEEMRDRVKEVLHVQRSRIFGVDYNSLGMARELWLVGGERSLLGHAVSLDEWAGRAAVGPPHPFISLAPTDDHRKYGLNYMDMDTRAKFDCRSLCTSSVRMRDPLSGRARPRYILEVYNKGRFRGKGDGEFDECDAYVTGCLARSCGAAIAWTLGAMQQQAVSDFALDVLSATTFEQFTETSCEALKRLFSCEEAILYWVDADHHALWRFKTEAEIKRDNKAPRGGSGNRLFVPLDEVSLAAEAFKKVDMSGKGEQFVLKVDNAPKHPKFNPDYDQRYIYRGMAEAKELAGAVYTRCVLSVPITDPHDGGGTIAVVQLRNKIADPALKSDFTKNATFRTDDAAFLQHFALQGAPIFMHALQQGEAEDMEAHLEQAEYAVVALMHISNTLAAGTSIDDLFPLVVHEAKKLMHCDRATLFLVEDDEAGNQMLWSKIAISMPPIKVACKETSIAGATVKKREVANILDAYRDPRFDPAWDRKSGYRTRSILCVPVVDELRDRCLGCLQLLNKFDRNGRAEGASFGHKDEELATNLCSVVSIAIKSATSEAHAHGAVELAAKTTHAGDDTGYATTHR